VTTAERAEGTLGALDENSTVHGRWMVQNVHARSLT